MWRVMAAPAKKENRSIYGVHPGIAMVQTR
jgi:hypothetical protein